MKPVNIKILWYDVYSAVIPPPAHRGGRALVMLRSLTLSLWLAPLLVADPAIAADVSRCSMVAEGRAEVIGFDADGADGKRVTLRGLLTGPEGAGPFGSIVILPGGRGPRSPGCYESAVEQFVDWGFVTLIVVPVPARDQRGTETFQYDDADLASYAHGAATALAAMPQVDATRIALWGHSRGGAAVIYAVSKARDMRSRFRAAVAAAPWPGCPDKAAPIAIPLLVLIGAKDATSSAGSCVDYAAKMADVGGFEFMLIPDAGHSYWNPAGPAYDESAAKLAARRLRALFEKHSLLAP